MLSSAPPPPRPLLPAAGFPALSRGKRPARTCVHHPTRSSRRRDSGRTCAAGGRGRRQRLRLDIHQHEQIVAGRCRRSPPPTRRAAGRSPRSPPLQASPPTALRPPAGRQPPRPAGRAGRTPPPGRHCSRRSRPGHRPAARGTRTVLRSPGPPEAGAVFALLQCDAFLPDDGGRREALPASLDRRDCCRRPRPGGTSWKAVHSGGATTPDSGSQAGERLSAAPPRRARWHLTRLWPGSLRRDSVLSSTHLRDAIAGIEAEPAKRQVSGSLARSPRCPRRGGERRRRQFAGLPANSRRGRVRPWFWRSVDKLVGGLLPLPADASADVLHEHHAPPVALPMPRQAGEGEPQQRQDPIRHATEAPPPAGRRHRLRQAKTDQQAGPPRATTAAADARIGIAADQGGQKRTSPP